MARSCCSTAAPPRAPTSQGSSCRRPCCGRVTRSPWARTGRGCASSGTAFRARAPAPATVEPRAAVSPPPPSHTLVVRAMAHSSRAFRRAVALVALIAALALWWAWRVNRRVQAELATLQQQVSRVEAERRTFEQRVDAERRRGDAERQTLERRIEDYRTREEDLRSRLSGAATGEVESLRTELGRTQQRIASLETERAAGEEIIRLYGGGVCLIQGAYAFYDKNDRPLRYKEGLDDHPPDENTAVLSPD